MQADFLDAHERHLEDAETLFMKSRWANADHLYGVSAECGLKRLMMAFDMPFNSDTGDPTLPADKQHINQIWAQYESYRNGHHRGIGYALPQPNPFANWKASQRYAHQEQFTEERVAGHRNGLHQVRLLLKKAILEGLI